MGVWSVVLLKFNVRKETLPSVTKQFAATTERLAIKVVYPYIFLTIHHAFFATVLFPTSIAHIEINKYATNKYTIQSTPLSSIWESLVGHSGTVNVNQIMNFKTLFGQSRMRVIKRV
jgi:hypothetical protein